MRVLIQLLIKLLLTLEFTGIDADGVATTKPQKMTDADQLVSSSIGNMQKAIDNLSLQRAFVGGQLSKAATQIDVVGVKKAWLLIETFHVWVTLTLRR